MNSPKGGESNGQQFFKAVACCCGFADFFSLGLFTVTNAAVDSAGAQRPGTAGNRVYLIQRKKVQCTIQRTLAVKCRKGLI